MEQFIASCSLHFINLIQSLLLEEPYKVKLLKVQITVFCMI